MAIGENHGLNVERRNYFRLVLRGVIARNSNVGRCNDIAPRTQDWHNDVGKPKPAQTPDICAPYTMPNPHIVRNHLTDF